MSPSFSNSPSSWATSSGNPWNGAVVSKTSFFIDLLRLGVRSAAARRSLVAAS
jgi:hypothetical protein